jgi:hypothetical protein
VRIRSLSFVCHLLSFGQAGLSPVQRERRKLKDFLRNSGRDKPINQDTNK